MRWHESGQWSAVFDHEDGTLRASRLPLRRGPISLFLSGHVSNADEVARALGGSGLGPGPDSAQALLLAAWERWGGELPRHVLGAYCLALVDHGRNQVTLLQDALGQRQMFHARVGAACYFSDTLAGLLGATSQRPLCLDYFAAWLRFGYGASELTPHEGLLRLAHGGQLRSTARHSMRAALVTPQPAALAWSCSRAEAGHELVRQVEQAVQRECAGLRQPLFELSGGLDSSTVVALAASTRAGRQLDVLTWDSPGDDDASHAAQLAGQLGLRQRVIARPPTDFIAWQDGMGWAEPGNELSGGLRAVLNGLLDHRHDGIVTGVGGDNIFHGRGLRPEWLADLVRAGRWSEVGRIVRSPAPDGNPQRLWWSQLWRYGLRPLLARAAHAAWPEAAPHYRYSAQFLRRCAALAPVDWNLPQDASVARTRYWRQIRALVANRVAISHLCPEIQYRHPLLSLPLVEYAAATLGRYEQHLHPDRTLQRSAFAGRVPEHIVRRTSKGGSLAQEAAYWRSAEARLRFHADRSRVVGLGLVDAAQWQSMVGAAGFGRVPSLREFDFLMKTEIWLRVQSSAAIAPAHMMLVA